MGRTVGIPPAYLNKLNEKQRTFILTATGLRFYDEFLTAHGKHLFIFGLTSAGKTNKGYAFVDWLKHLETQIWFDSGKQGEFLPLLCMDRKIRIVVPTGTTVIIEERVGGIWKPIENHPEILPVSTPADAVMAISPGSWSEKRNRIRDTITIISFRNGFTKKEIAISWVASFFETLAEKCRNPYDGQLPRITPASIHVDESQWAIAGKRISGEGERNRASEVIAENVLELRSAGFRMVLYAQGYTNIPPAARENMLFNVICHGGMVTTEENGNVAKWCNNAIWRSPPSPMSFKVQHGRFVFENGDSYPPQRPWTFSLYPLDERDRKWVGGLRVRYEGKHDHRKEEAEQQEECFPELGRFQALAIKPEVQEMVESRWNMPEGGMVDD
jgi:hypothetical protein